MIFNFKLLIIAIFITFLSTIAKSGSISNCSTCGSGFGDKIGEVNPKNIFFNRASVRMTCPRAKNTTYKNSATWTDHLSGFYNNDYIWLYKKQYNRIRIILGYKTTNNNFRFDGRDIWYPDKSSKTISGFVKNKTSIINILENGIEIKRTQKSNVRICKLAGTLINIYSNQEKKTEYEAAIRILKDFEKRQYDVINQFSILGYKMNARFNVTEPISKLSIKLAMLDNQPKVIIKEDEESKRLVEQKSKELEQEKARRIAEEKERKILEAKTKKLAEEKRLAELKAKKRTEDIAKEVAAEKQKKIEEERALRKAEELKRKKAEERAKKIALEKKLAEEKARKEAKERAIKLAEERRKTEEVAKRLEQERLKAELKTKKLEKAQQIQLAALEKEKAEKQKLILEEKKKRDELEKKLAALREENKKQGLKSNSVQLIKLPPEWEPYKFDLSPQQRQFCQLTNRFFKDMDKAVASKNEIRINIVHRDRQQNLDGLLPGGKVNNWIFKVLKIDQVEDGSAAVVLSLQCNSFVGSGQIHTKSSWRKKSNKEWRATIPYDDRRFRELAKLGVNDFILGSGTLLEVNAFKPGQIETFYASQQIGEHPLTKDLNLKGELFLADLSYIAALN